MLKNFDAYDTILMPLNPADPAYLSFEKMVLPVAVQRGLGIQAMKSTANAGLLSDLASEGLPDLRSEPAGPLPGAGVHHHRAGRGRRADRAAVPADAGAADGAGAGTGEAAGRSAAGKLEARCTTRAAGSAASRWRAGLSLADRGAVSMGRRGSEIARGVPWARRRSSTASSRRVSGRTRRRSAGSRAGSRSSCPCGCQRPVAARLGQARRDAPVLRIRRHRRRPVRHRHAAVAAGQ